jgi:hypothetical protein
MASIDRIDWHSGGDFPKNLPAENGGTHIGMYLTWIIDNDLIGQMHLDESADAIKKVKARQITGRDFLIEMCDEKFWADDLNEEGLKFTKHYYQSEGEGYGLFLDDYDETLGQNTTSLYEIENTWDNYNKLKPILDKRYADWRKSIN